MQLTEEEEREMLPSRNQPVFYNRVTWVIAHFKAGKIIDNTRRGYIKIRPSGIDILKRNPSIINSKFLKQLPTYIEAMSRWKTKNSTEEILKNEDGEKTPEELIEFGYQSIQVYPYIREAGSSIIKKFMRKRIRLTNNCFVHFLGIQLYYCNEGVEGNPSCKSFACAAKI